MSMTAAGSPPLPAHDAASRLRAVQRAAGDLKRGVPVILGGPAPLVVMAAETASASGLAAFRAIACEPGALLLAPVRAASVLHRPIEHAAPAVALRLLDGEPDLARLRALADPTLEQMIGEPPATAPVPSQAAAALALAKLARLLPAMLAAGVTAEAMDRAAGQGLLFADAADVLAYPSEMAAGLVRVAEARVPLAAAGDVRVVAFRAPETAIEHLAVLVGEPETAPAPLVRIHSECFTGDLLGSLRCDCGPQLHGALARMADEGAGALLYLAQEGRGIGLANKLRAYALQDRGMDTLDANRALGWGADERDFLIAATMLRELGIGRVRLLTNNPDKIAALTMRGIEVAGRVSHIYAPNGVNDRYLETKARLFGHLLG